MSPNARSMGVRARATLVSVVVVGVVLAASAFVFAVVTRSRIESSIIEAATARVDAIVAIIQADALVDPLPVRDPESFGQVVEATGGVVAADRAIADLGPLSQPGLAVGERQRTRTTGLVITDETEPIEGPFVVISEGVELSGGTGVVVVAASLEDASEALGATVPLLAVGLPALLAIVGATTWVLTGRALRPVERMRTEADRISAAALDQRLPLPGSRDEIHRLAATLNEMLERLEASAVEQRRFVADASHELRSPLAALRTMVEVSERDTGARGDAELMADLANEIERLQRLADDLLYLAHDDEARPSHRTGEVDLDQVVMAEATALAQRTGLEVDTRGIEPVRVHGDADRLAQLVRNLTDNAGRHAVGRVWLTAFERDDEAVVTVSDDGPGVPAEARHRVFERFVRLDDSRARGTGGAGLGLAVARAIARSHGGDVRVVEPQTGGATFEALFPSGS